MASPAGPLVSVLVPAHEQERFVGRAVASILRQGYPRLEVVVVDDGSTDATAEAAERAAARDRRVTVLRQERRGPARLAETYARALEAARGDLVAFCDADDAWPPRKLEVQVPDFADAGVVVSFGDYAWIDENDAPIRTIRLSESLPAEALRNRPVGRAAWHMAGLARRTFTFPSATAVRRSALERVGGFRALPGDVGVVDFPTFLELATVGAFAYHPRVLGLWRRHPRSLTLRHEAAITAAAFRYSMEFLLGHPEVVAGDLRVALQAWRSALARAALSEARANLLGRRWRDASRLFRSVLRRPAPPALRAAALAGLGAAALRVDLEPVLGPVRGYDLRGLRRP